MPGPLFNLPLFVSLWPLLLGAVALGPDEGVRTMVVEDQVTIRIPVRIRRLPQIEWRERKGPKCVDPAGIAGAMLAGPNSVDFLLRDRSRIRAELDDACPALDFYGGFYLQPRDDEVCARRDVIRSRMGGECRIDRFHKLEPKLKD